MARTIQKKIKFSKGQVVPELVERTDMEFYDSSAQTIKNMVSTIYGGVRTRRGTKKIDRILAGVSEITGTATSGMGGNSSYIQDRNNRFVTETVAGNREIFKITYDSQKPAGLLKVRGIKLDFEAPDIQASITTGSDFYTVRSATWNRYTRSYSYYYYSSVNISYPGVGITSDARIYPNPKTNWNYPLNYGDIGTSTPTFSYVLDSKGSVNSVSITNAGKRESMYGAPSTDLIFERNSEPRAYSATAYYSVNGTDWVAIGTKMISETSQDFDFTIPVSFQYVKMELDATNDSIGTTISMQYASAYTGAVTKTVYKLVDFVFNNDEKYVFVLMPTMIHIFKDNILVYTVSNANGLTSGVIKDIKWTYKDDTIIFTHPDMPPKELRRTGLNTFTWSSMTLKNIPFYAFGGETETEKSVGITPSSVEGSVKITADSSIFSSDWVGQYIDGNGGRLRITEYTSGTVVKGVTVIPFYTTDKITSWKYVSGYEEVWSASKGYPITCLFAQQRLWFGGSKMLPAHIWGSRLGDYTNFKNAGNYDNDAIDVTMLTNNRIVNMIECRGIHVFTSGEEWTAPEGSLTPDTFRLAINTTNGSLSSVRPVAINGIVCYVEKNGKSLMSYVYNDTQASYVSDNLSILSNLIENPVALSAEINSSVDKGDFLFIVNKDGTMLSSCINIQQNIMSLSMFETSGKILDVCSIVGDTYLLIDRGVYVYLEKIEETRTDATTDIAVFPTPQQDLYAWKYEGDIIYTNTETPTTVSVIYDIYYEETGKVITAVGDGTITVDGHTYERNEDGDTESVMYVSVLSDYNGQEVILYDGDTVYEKSYVGGGKLIVNEAINKMCKVGLSYNYDLESNPIAINHKTDTIKKRISKATVLCKDTNELTFSGQKKMSNKDKFEFYSCTKYDNDVRFKITGSFKPVNILSVTLDINYEG